MKVTIIVAHAGLGAPSGAMPGDNSETVGGVAQFW